jgi:hypothetical protein
MITKICVFSYPGNTDDYFSAYKEYDMILLKMGFKCQTSQVVLAMVIAKTDKRSVPACIAVRSLTIFFSFASGGMHVENISEQM